MSGNRYCACNWFLSSAEMKRTFFLQAAWGLIAASGIAPGAFSQQPATPPSRPALAVVEAQAIYEEDLLPQILPQMRQMRQQEYELKNRALQGLIDQKLLEAEANRRDVSVADLLKQEIDAKVAQPTDAEVQSYYLERKERINRPLEEVKEQIRQGLRQARLQEVRQSFFQHLRGTAQVAVYLSSPRIEVGYDSARMRGAPDAPVTIVEFSDFQCPFCQRAYPVIRELLSKYQGQVKLAYRDFPLRSIHAQAQMAAEASRCAGEQGKFWEYHDRLFDPPNQLDKEALTGHAASLNLDPQGFQACLESGRHRLSVEQDLQDGTQAGVTGTPAFFINGILVSGAQPAAAFEKTIEAELAAIQQKRAPPKQ